MKTNGKQQVERMIDDMVQRRMENTGETEEKAWKAVAEALRPYLEKRPTELGKIGQPNRDIAQETRDAQWMWLSFSEPSGWLGAAIVRGHDVCECCDEAWRLKINPGGECRGIAIQIENIPESYRNRLLNREEATALQKLDIQLRYATPEDARRDHFGIKSGN